MAFEDKSFPTEEREIITVYLYKVRTSFFLWTPLKLCQFIPPLKSSLNICLTSTLLQDLNIMTGCEMLVVPALFPCIKHPLHPCRVWEITSVCLAGMGKDLRPKLELFNSALLWVQGSAAPRSKGLLLLQCWVVCAKLSQVRWIICTEVWLILCLFQFAREQGTNCNSSLKITSA